MSHKTSRRNGNIEFLRFMFCLSIVLFHGGLHFRGGYLAVEFFFIVTGFFLYKKVGNNGQKDEKISVLKESLFDFLHRYFSLLPILIFPTFAGIIIRAIVSQWSLFEVLIQLIRSVGDFLLLQNFGIGVTSGTGVIWYVGSMLFAIWIIYPLLKNNSDCLLYISPIVIFFNIGLIIKSVGSLEAPNSMLFGWLNTGFLRAINGILMGVIIGFICRKSKNLAIDEKKSIILGCLELLLYLVFFAYMFAWNDKFGDVDWIAIIVLFVAMCITFSQKSCFYGIFDNKCFLFLGESSKYIFLNHFQIISHRTVLFGNDLFIQLVLSFAFVILLSVVDWIISKPIKIITDRLHSKLLIILN